MTTSFFNYLVFLLSLGPFTCEDQLPNCNDIVIANPEVCTEYADYAWANCRKTCGVGECGQGVTCNDDASLGDTGVRVKGADSLTAGEQVVYACAEGFYHVSGDLSRACLSSGSLTGTTPVCSDSVTNIELFTDKSLFSRSSTFSGDDTYVAKNLDKIFPVGGKVTSWNFYSNIDGGEISFQIFRPVTDPEKKKTLTFIGQNEITGLPGMRVHTVVIPEADQISVQKGDVIGLYVSSGEIGYDSCNGDVDTDHSGWMYTKASSRPNEMVIGKDYDFKTSTYAGCRVASIRATLNPTG